MVMNLGPPDVQWLVKLLRIVEEQYEDYPELFTKRDEETLKIARQLIRSLQ